MFIRIFFEKCRDGKKVAVVYYRAGYTPNDYPSEAV
jgi:glutathione synthase